jgi:hypothetical protein
MDYMSQFDFDITYVKGELNKVADCLSRYFENYTMDEAHEVHDYVRADTRMDPLGEDLPTYRFNEMKERVVEIRTLRSMELRSHWLAELKEDRNLEAQVMAEVNAQLEPGLVTTAPSIHDEDITGTQLQNDEDVSLAKVLVNRAADQQPTAPEVDQFLQAVQKGYKQDTILSIVINKPEEHKGFTLCNGLIWRKKIQGDQVLCIPQVPQVITTILDQAHSTLGHFGNQCTAEYLWRWYWWPKLLWDVREFCKTCEPCQQLKGSTKKPFQKLHPLPIPIKPWVGPFPESKGFNYLWVIIC